MATPGELSSAVRSLVSARSASSPDDRLTDRERHILAELATSKSNAAIAAAAFVGERAVEKHINSISSKPGLMRRSR